MPTIDLRSLMLASLLIVRKMVATLRFAHPTI
jgi:hypothetical protein